MGLLQWLGVQRTTLSYSDWARLLSPATRSGRAVTWESALGVTTVLACARAYANGLAQVPFAVRQKLQPRGSEPATSHPLYPLVSTAWSDRQTSFEARQQVGLHLALTNNAYVYKVKSPLDGRLLELKPLDPRVIAAKEASDGSMEYRVQMRDGTVKVVPPELIWHIRYMTWDGATGMDAVKLVREAIGLAMSAEEHGNRFFGNGARLSGVLTTDATLKPDQLKELRQSWEDTYGGSANAFKTAVLYAGLKYQPIGAPADQSQYTETRTQQVEEICRGFGVLPIMVGHADKTATYASAEAMFEAHVRYTLMPIYSAVEQSADLSLLPAAERASGLYHHLNANGLLRGSVAARGQFYTQLSNIGALSPNDVRELEDMNPRAGGDQYRVPMNSVPNDGSTPDPGVPNA